jgi:hypothetical protein
MVAHVAIEKQQGIASIFATPATSALCLKDHGKP